MAVLSKNVLYYGSDEPLPEKRLVRAGPLSATYEAGDLRFIRLGDQEILRRIYVAVRDYNWDTIPATLSNVVVKDGGDTFHISYDARHQQGDIDFVWKGSIDGTADGSIQFSMHGEARSTFLRNRIGFCLLHPASCAGQDCIIEHVDGTVEEGHFPRQISPHQPFKDIRAITHTVRPEVQSRVSMEGEIFEMEDQRNWTDASFKTYCTPLAQPFPAEVTEGAEIRQSVTVALQGEVATQVTGMEDEALTLTVGNEPTTSLPRIGLGMSTQEFGLSPEEVQRLRALRLSHLRVDLRLNQSGWESDLRRAVDEADELGARVEAALHFSEQAEAELAALRRKVHDLQPSVLHWLVFHEGGSSSRSQGVKLAREYLADYDNAPLFGTGTNTYFTELNRERPPLDELDLVCYSINPQVHAFDNTSLVESLPTQAATVEAARHFVDDLPVAVTPVTLKPRFNPNATGPETEPANGELPPAVDQRQMSLFGAGWTLGSLKYLAESELHSVTYYETIGWHGVMERIEGSPRPEQFQSLPGSVFPVYHVLADVGDFAGGEVIKSHCNDPLRADGIVLVQNGRHRLLLANLSPEPQTIQIHNVGESVHLRWLDERTAQEAMTAPERYRQKPRDELRTSDSLLSLDFLPYAIACVDW